eukprot:scaffold27408_cov174-Isochrysis_galbana.AAC.2
MYYGLTAPADWFVDRPRVVQYMAEQLRAHQHQLRELELQQQWQNYSTAGVLSGPLKPCSSASLYTERHLSHHAPTLCHHSSSLTGASVGLPPITNRSPAGRPFGSSSWDARPMTATKRQHTPRLPTVFSDEVPPGLCGAAWLVHRGTVTVSIHHHDGLLSCVRAVRGLDSSPLFRARHW